MTQERHRSAIDRPTENEKNTSILAETENTHISNCESKIETEQTRMKMRKS